MRKAVRVRAERSIPSLVVGGYAVQENSYARFTSDVDIRPPRDFELDSAIQPTLIQLWDGLSDEEIRQ